MLFFELSKLSLKRGFSLGLSLLVLVDLARSEEIVEGYAGVGLDYGIDLLRGCLSSPCKQCIRRLEGEQGLTSFLLMLRIFLFNGVSARVHPVDPAKALVRIGYVLLELLDV